MTQNNIVRKQLLEVIENYGIKLKHIANELGWNYTNLSSFKNGKSSYSLKRLRELENYLKSFLKSVTDTNNNRFI